MGERTECVSFLVEIIRVARVDEDLQGYAQLLAVPEHAGVCIGNAPRAGVEVLAFVESANLALAIDLLVAGAAPDGPAETADPVARFEDLIVVAELAKLVANGQSRQARTEHEDAGAGCSALQGRAGAGRGAH